MKYQFGTTSRGGRRKTSYAFIEHAAIMLETVLNSKRAIDESIHFTRALLKMCEFVLMSKEITKKLGAFEFNTDRKLAVHYNMFKVVFDTIKKYLFKKPNTKNQLVFKSISIKWF